MSEYTEQQLTPTTDKEKMLVAATLRMCRGVGGESRHPSDAEWRKSSDKAIHLIAQYRAEPPKTPKIPWEWLPDDIEALRVMTSGAVAITTKINNSPVWWVPVALKLKLDLDGVTLPVTVRRPV
jgi:hypothetical protein